MNAFTSEEISSTMHGVSPSDIRPAVAGAALTRMIDARRGSYMEEREAKQLLTPSDVARILHVSTNRVRQLDDVLLPTKTMRGARLYERYLVERYLVERERAAAKRDAARSACNHRSAK